MMRSTAGNRSLLSEIFARQIQNETLSEQIDLSLAAKKQYLAFSFSIHPIDVLAAVEQQAADNDFLYYWEKPVDEFAIAAGGELKRLVSSGTNRYRSSSKKGKELLNSIHHWKAVSHPNAVVHLLGGFSFFNENKSATWQGFEAASFTLPEWSIVCEGKSCILTACIPLLEGDSKERIKIRFFELLNRLEAICNVEEYTIPHQKPALSIPHYRSDQELDFLHWKEMIEQAKQEISRGTFRKVVLARELKLKLSRSASATYILNKLRRQYPECTSFLIRHNSTPIFIGSTPERLASFKANFVLTEGLAGSISRGETASQDARLEYDLLHSAKDLEEHGIVLEAITDQLNEFSHQIDLPVAPDIKKLSNVQHLYTPIRAALKKGVSRTEVLQSLHPTPAVGGYPRQASVQFIQEHEHFDRGWYAAPIGWINAHGNGEFVVAIRSGLIKNDEVRFFAGCGIVQDSDPKKEWDETNIKFIPMLSALNYAGT